MESGPPGPPLRFLEWRGNLIGTAPADRAPADVQAGADSHIAAVGAVLAAIDLVVIGNGLNIRVARETEVGAGVPARAASFSPAVWTSASGKNAGRPAPRRGVAGGNVPFPASVSSRPHGRQRCFGEHLPTHATLHSAEHRGAVGAHSIVGILSYEFRSPKAVRAMPHRQVYLEKKIVEKYHTG